MHYSLQVWIMLIIGFVRQAHIISAQPIVKTIISSFLRECYSESHLLDRNNLPPMNLNVLLDLIRKVEDSEVGDMREFSVAIAQLFRQDGIIYDPTATGSQNIIPFKPTGFQAFKNRLLLNKLIPNSLLNLDRDFLVAEDKCALHHMVSSSIALHFRGDEEFTCKRIITGPNSNLRMGEYTRDNEIELFDVNAPIHIIARQITGVSNCPIETGVVSTPWGEVSMGTVITGIAAGLEEQKVLISDLVTVQPGFDNNTIVVNNRYAATLSGDIAEAAVRQGVSRISPTVGAPGGWNSTTPRRHYFLNRSENLELTDAEIRGGLDGVILSELAKIFVDRFPEFRLSQLIDMYYSDNGVLHESRFRACNRKVLVPDVASTRTLVEETLGPAVALYHTSSLSGSTTLKGIETFINDTILAFQRYIPSNINDSSCTTNNDRVLRPRVNLILITEPTFSRSPLISHIVDQIDVSKFGSSIMLVNSATGDIVVDKTFSVSTFYEQFARRRVAQAGVLEMSKILEKLIHIVMKEMDKESRFGYSGGNATVALFISDTIPQAGTERVRTLRHIEWLQGHAPDLRLLFAASAASENVVTTLLRNIEGFIPISLPSLSPTMEELKPVINAVLETPRRIINPDCGSKMTSDGSSGVVSFEGFLDANGINFYRLLPNYFFGSSTTRLIRVRSFEHGPITVCYSRTNSSPRRNLTSGTMPADVTCEFAESDADFVEIMLDDACNAFSTISSCPPVYISVATTIQPEHPQCREPGCRFPNDVKYLVAAHDLGCYSSTTIIKASQICFYALLLLFIYK